jgi:Mechanosensitive ion channel
MATPPPSPPGEGEEGSCREAARPVCGSDHLGDFLPTSGTSDRGSDGSNDDGDDDMMEGAEADDDGGLPTSPAGSRTKDDKLMCGLSEQERDCSAADLNQKDKQPSSAAATAAVPPLLLPVPVDTSSGAAVFNDALSPPVTVLETLSNQRKQQAKEEEEEEETEEEGEEASQLSNVYHSGGGHVPASRDGRPVEASAQRAPVDGDESLTDVERGTPWPPGALLCIQGAVEQEVPLPTMTDNNGDATKHFESGSPASVPSSPSSREETSEMKIQLSTQGDQSSCPCSGSGSETEKLVDVVLGDEAVPVEGYSSSPPLQVPSSAPVASPVANDLQRILDAEIQYEIEGEERSLDGIPENGSEVDNVGIGDSSAVPVDNSSHDSRNHSAQEDFSQSINLIEAQQDTSEEYHSQSLTPRETTQQEPAEGSVAQSPTTAHRPSTEGTVASPASPTPPQRSPNHSDQQWQPDQHNSVPTTEQVLDLRNASRDESADETPFFLLQIRPSTATGHGSMSPGDNSSANSSESPDHVLALSELLNERGAARWRSGNRPLDQEANLVSRDESLDETPFFLHLEDASSPHGGSNLLSPSSIPDNLIGEDFLLTSARSFPGEEVGGMLGSNSDEVVLQTLLHTPSNRPPRSSSLGSSISPHASDSAGRQRDIEYEVSPYRAQGVFESSALSHGSKSSLRPPRIPNAALRLPGFGGEGSAQTLPRGPGSAVLASNPPTASHSSVYGSVTRDPSPPLLGAVTQLHRRAASETSFLSALTDVSTDYVHLPIARSFDNHEPSSEFLYPRRMDDTIQGNIEVHIPLSLQQPILMDDFGSSPIEVDDDHRIVTVVSFDDVREEKEEYEPVSTPIKESSAIDTQCVPACQTPTSGIAMGRSSSPQRTCASIKGSEKRPFEVEAAALIRRVVEGCEDAGRDVNTARRSIARTTLEARHSPQQPLVPGTHNGTKDTTTRRSKMDVILAAIKRFSIGVTISAAFAVCAALAMLTLAAMVVNVVAFSLVVASLLVSISIMIGSIVAAFAEGLLLIVVQRPYVVGDRIVMASVEDFDQAGWRDLEEKSCSQCWIVEDCNTYSTTLRHGMGHQVITLTNGALARKRIVNLTRSGRARVSVVVPLLQSSTDSKIRVRTTHRSTPGVCSSLLVAPDISRTLGASLSRL